MSEIQSQVAGSKTGGVKLTPLIDRQQTISARRRHYETIFIVAPGADEKAVNDLMEKSAGIIDSTGGVLLRQDDWGKLRMAYMINKHAQGRYFYFRFVGSHNSIKAFERNLKLDINVLRFQTVRISEDLSESEISDLMQRAPKEPSSPPTAQRFDEDIDFS